MAVGARIAPSACGYDDSLLGDQIAAGADDHSDLISDRPVRRAVSTPAGGKSHCRDTHRLSSNDTTSTPQRRPS